MQISLPPVGDPEFHGGRNLEGEFNGGAAIRKRQSWAKVGRRGKMGFLELSDF